MARTLMVRPHVLSLSCQALPFFLRTKTPTFSSQSFVALFNNNDSETRIKMISATAELRVRSGGAFYGFGGRAFRGTTTTVRAAHVNDAGYIDSPLMQSMEKKIKEQLNAESVSVRDAYGDGRHVSIDVVSTAFEGQSAVNRQRMVYKAIWEELQSTVHAVDQMTTRTPSEASADKS